MAGDCRHEQRTGRTNVAGIARGGSHAIRHLRERSDVLVTGAQVARGGYLIRTTLDPKVQTSVKRAIDKFASPSLNGIASVVGVITPGKDAHRVIAMASNRTYGLNSEAHATVQAQPFSLVSNGIAPAPPPVLVWRGPIGGPDSLAVGGPNGPARPRR